MSFIPAIEFTRWPHSRRLPFDRNTNDFHFDTEIIIQLIKACMRIHEIPIPTYYGDEICHVNGIKYAWDVAKTTLRSRAHELCIFYDSKFDCEPEQEANAYYEPKLGYDSSHSASSRPRAGRFESCWIWDAREATCARCCSGIAIVTAPASISFRCRKILS